LVADVSTARRHLEASHAGTYQAWAEKNNFESMLPKDSKARRTGQAPANQSRLDSHVKERLAEENMVKYTDTLFRQAAIEWLIATDQPIHAMEHPAFKNMIAIAARATNGVTIPKRKQTRQAIIALFKDNLTKLRKCLNVRF
ncbi:hypothetical protein DICSQDRAFT_59826, partial [Dichomitus squalens LYAD-421 SS1]